MFDCTLMNNDETATTRDAIFSKKKKSIVFFKI